MPVERAGKGLSGREDTDIVNERKRPPEASAAIGPQHNLLDRGIFQCQSRHELKSVAAEPVSAQANDGRELVARMECVLSGHTGIEKFLTASPGVNVCAATFLIKSSLYLSAVPPKASVNL